jgi:hypothetical protein
MLTYETLAKGRPLPDESDFREWMRVHYNDLEASAAYKSVESKAYQYIVGAILLPGTGIDLEDDETYLDVIKMQIWEDATEEGRSQPFIDLCMEAYALIEDYQERIKKPS